MAWLDIPEQDEDSTATRQGTLYLQRHWTIFHFFCLELKNWIQIGLYSHPMEYSLKLTMTNRRKQWVAIYTRIFFQSENTKVRKLMEEKKRASFVNIELLCRQGKYGMIHSGHSTAQSLRLTHAKAAASKQKKEHRVQRYRLNNYFWQKRHIYTLYLIYHYRSTRSSNKKAKRYMVSIWSHQMPSMSI